MKNKQKKSIRTIIKEIKITYKCNRKISISNTEKLQSSDLSTCTSKTADVGHDIFSFSEEKQKAQNLSQYKKILNI